MPPLMSSCGYSNKKLAQLFNAVSNILHVPSGLDGHRNIFGIRINNFQFSIQKIVCVAWFLLHIKPGTDFAVFIIIYININDIMNRNHVIEIEKKDEISQQSKPCL
jgi:hypothetical protein